MNRNEFLFTLKAITREISCMNPEVFEDRLKEGLIEFDRFSFSEPYKVHTKIHVEKIFVEEK